MPIEDDPQRGAVGDERHVVPAANDLRHTERHGEVADVRRQFLLHPISVEYFHEQSGVAAAQERVVHPGGLRHVPRDAHVHAAHEVEDAAHR
jgi:hypothetical protein